MLNLHNYMKEIKGRRTERPRIEHLDFSKVNPKIADRLNVMKACQLGFMPDGWMGSFIPTAATVDHLAAAEWDSRMIVYARALRNMASQADAVLAEVEDTPENRAAVYSARQALIGLAELYYDEAAQRPGVGLSDLLHWSSKTEQHVNLAKDKNFSSTDLRQIILGRMSSVTTELDTLLGFVKSGGWKSANERDRFCSKLSDTTKSDIHNGLLADWQAAGGESTQFESSWTVFTETIGNYLERFQAMRAPDHAIILGDAGVIAYLEKVGLAETSQEIINWCENEAKLIRAELERLRRMYPEVTELSYPTNDAAILEAAEATRQYYIKHFMDSGIIPSDIDIQSVNFAIRNLSEIRDLTFASIDPGYRTISCLPASESDAWSTNWAFWVKTVIHELTHKVQHEAKTQVKEGWMSLEAQDGAAVAMEWLATATDDNLTAGSMYRILQYALRQTIRMKLGLQYHSGKLTDSQLRQRLQDEGEFSHYALNSAVEQVQNSLPVIGAYWMGPRFIAALTKTDHNGNLSSAMQQLAQSTGLRLPGHVLINGARLDKFKLTDHLPTIPIPVQISQHKFK